MTEPRVIVPVESPVQAVVRPPGSKSQTIRGLVIAALGVGESMLHRPLDAEDTRFARQALAQLGVETAAGEQEWSVRGAGGRLGRPDTALDAGASGLTARSMIAIASLVDGPVTVTGRDRLPDRPVGGLVTALRDLGVKVSDGVGGLPVTINGRGHLPGGEVTVRSDETTQFATALLMAAPLADGPLLIRPEGLKGSQRYIEVTIETMRRFGAQVATGPGGYRVDPTGYQATRLDIEPDASAAVYPMVAAAITGGRARIEGLGKGSLQPDLDVAGVLGKMGCLVEITDDATVIDARGRQLRGVEVDLSASPDGSLALAVAAMFADGPSRLGGLGSLRFKESDRLAAVANEISRLGAEAEIEGDLLVVNPGPIRPATVETYGDHRMAMAFALVGLAVPGIAVADPEVVAKTWPQFWEMLDRLSASEPS